MINDYNKKAKLMRRRILISFIFIWMLAVTVLCIFQMRIWEGTDRKGAYVGGVVVDGETYAIEKRDRGSFLLKITREGGADYGKAAKSFGYDTYEAITGSLETVTVLLSRENPYADSRTYEILILSPELMQVMFSEPFLLDGGARFSTMTEEGDVIYLTCVSEDKESIYLYQISKDELVNAENVLDEGNTSDDTTKAERIAIENENAVELDISLTLAAEENRLFAEGLCYSGTLYGWQDNEAPSQLFYEDEKVKDTYLAAPLSAREMIRRHPYILTVYVILGVAGVFTTLLLLIGGKDRDRQSFFITRLVVMTLLFAGCFFLVYDKVDDTLAARELEMLSDTARDFAKKVGSRFPETDSIEEFYSSNAYLNLRNESELSLVDALVIRTEGNFGEIVLSKSCHNYALPESLYGEGLPAVAELAYSTGEYGNTYHYQGTTYLMSGVSLRRGFGLPYTVVAVKDHERLSEKMFARLSLPFALIYILTIVVILLREFHSRLDLNKLARGMIQASDETKEVKAPDQIPRYLKVHWDALTEIEKRFRKTNYSVYQTYRAYYRFAPKQIENILRKESISEVKCGDTIHFTGTEAILSFSDKFKRSSRGIDYMNMILGLMEKHRKQYNGVFISSDMGIRQAKLLFRSDTKNTHEFGKSFLGEAQGVWQAETVPASVILHYSEFDYGIVGTEEQSMAFLDSKESHLLEKFSGWLLGRGIRLVITERVAQRENIYGKLRYIGFIHEDNIKIKLYEVLDANLTEARAAKLRNLDRYNQALELLEAQDFYLARNLFSAILRELPDDAIAKWYLFECEKYLDEPMDKEPLRLVIDNE